MPKFKRILALWCLVVGTSNSALACETRYDPATKVAFIPCVGIVGATQVFSVFLEWADGNNFVLTNSEEYRLTNPFVSNLKILTTPFPVAIVFGQYSSSCVSGYNRPTFIQTGNNIDIRLKARSPIGANCSPVLVPFAEAVRLPESASSQIHTYSVNGESITPSY